MKDKVKHKKKESQLKLDFSNSCSGSFQEPQKSGAIKAKADGRVIPLSPKDDTHIYRSILNRRME